MTTNEKPQESPFEAAKPEETVPLLQSAVLRNASLQCWSPGQKHSYTSRVVRVNEVSGLVSISVSKEPAGGDEFEAALVNESLEELLLSTHLPTDVIFFKGEYRKGGSDFFTVRVKPPIFKVQRRISLRLSISNPDQHLVQMTLASGDVIQAKLNNFSDGGIGVSVSDKALFQRLCAEKPTADISFTVHGAAVSASAVVRHGFESGSTLSKKAYRLGLEFLTIDPKLKARLSQIAFEESSKYIGRA